MRGAKSNTHKLTQTALLISIGVLLPMAFHSIPNAGRIFLPMHIPILLCGIILGFPYGLVCGVLTPLLSFLLTGMPTAAALPAMLFELATYGVTAALIMRFVPLKNTYARIYAALIGAMLAGRLVNGTVNALFFKAGDYSLQVWLSAALITAWPGILIQMFAVPTIVIALKKAKLIEEGCMGRINTETQHKSPGSHL